MSWNVRSFLRAFISNDFFLALCTAFSCTSLNDCKPNTLGSDRHICLYFNSKITDLNNWGMFNGINIFPLVSLELLEEWISLINESIYVSMTANNALELFANPNILLKNRGVATPRTLVTKTWKILFSSMVSVWRFNGNTLVLNTPVGTISISGQCIPQAGAHSSRKTCRTNKLVRTRIVSGWRYHNRYCTSQIAPMSQPPADSDITDITCACIARHIR